MLEGNWMGRWVIDTKRKISATYVTRINDTEAILLVTDDGEYYITSEENLIPYDKYWFDKEEQK